MFDRIAPVYDAMNTVMTAGLDGRWRRAAAAATRLGPAMSAIDVACGTGALTRELARRVGPRGRVVGVDLSAAMLARARRAGGEGIEYVRADALVLPGGDDSFDAATIAFGLRNVSDYARCLRELARVTVGMVDALMGGGEPEINDTKTYNNGVKVVPSYLLEPVSVDKTNWEELLIGSGYYTKDQIQ